MKQKAKGGLNLASSSLQVIIADDYSDPFDAKNDLKSKAGKGESAGYMEPYEAQRIMTGKQGSWHKDLHSARRQRAHSWTHGWSPASLSRGRKVCGFKVVVGRLVCLIFTTTSQFMFAYIRKNLAGHSKRPVTRGPSTVTKIGTEK